MQLAYIMSSSRVGTDSALAEVARHLRQRGLRLCGTVQVNTERDGSVHCDMDLLVLPEGPSFRISQNRGNWARGCRLDAGSLETAVEHVARSVGRGADLMIINKFGKHEAEGRGFRSLIAAALEDDMPVLVGLNALNREAFDKFSGGLAIELAPEVGTILDWVGHYRAEERLQSAEVSLMSAVRVFRMAQRQLEWFCRKPQKSLDRSLVPSCTWGGLGRRAKGRSESCR